MNKTWLYLAGLAVAVLLGFFLYNKYRVAPGIDFPRLNLQQLDGTPIDFKVYNGKKTLVCFSASWCGNCYEELDLIKEVKEKYLQDVEVLVISDEPVEKIERFKERKRYPFTFLQLQGSFASIGINSIPTSYVINRKQKVVQQTVGYIDWSDDTTRKRLLDLME